MLLPVCNLLCFSFHTKTVLIFLLFADRSAIFVSSLFSSAAVPVLSWISGAGKDNLCPHIGSDSRTPGFFVG